MLCWSRKLLEKTKEVGKEARAKENTNTRNKEWIFKELERYKHWIATIFGGRWSLGKKSARGRCVESLKCQVETETRPLDMLHMLLLRTSKETSKRHNFYSNFQWHYRYISLLRFFFHSRKLIYSFEYILSVVKVQFNFSIAFPRRMGATHCFRHAATTFWDFRKKFVTVYCALRIFSHVVQSRVLRARRVRTMHSTDGDLWAFKMDWSTRKVDSIMR